MQHRLTRGYVDDADLAEVETLAGSSLLDSNYPGWYYSLPNTGEKVLAPAVTFLNKVIFTTFANDGEVGDDPCQVPPNSARAYVLNLFNGQAVANLDRSEDSSQDRSVVVGVNEILDGTNVPCPSSGDRSYSRKMIAIEIKRVGKMTALS